MHRPHPKLTAASMVLVFAATIAQPALAQPVFDGSTGGQANGAVAGASIDVDQGTRAGANVFHSFSSFSIPSGQSVTFTDASPSGAVSNIINRVTGAGQSQINGALRSTVPGADVYLINPNGVTIGAGGSVDVPAGFHVSTAHELRFANGQAMTMSAGNSSFTAAAPKSFGFLGGPVGEIRLKEARIEPGIGGEVTMVGGKFSIDDVIAGAQTALIFTRGAPVSIAAVAGTADVAIDPTAPSVISAYADVFLTGGAANVDRVRIRSDSADGVGLGGVWLRGRDVTLSNAFVLTEPGSKSKGGILDVYASGLLSLDNAAQISTSNNNSGSFGDVGDINVYAGSGIKIHSGSALDFPSGIHSSSHVGSATVGKITIDTPGTLHIVDLGSLAQTTGVTSAIRQGGTGNSGDISVSARDLLLEGGGIVGTFRHGVPGAGLSGNITINVDNSVKISGYKTINGVEYYSSINTSGNLNSASGFIIVNAKTIELSNKGELTSGAQDGQGGSIYLNAADLTMTTGEIDSFTYGSGDAGNVSINLSGEMVLTSNSFINASQQGASSGSAGFVQISAKKFSMSTGFIGSFNAGSGNAKGITLEVLGETKIKDGARLNSVGVQGDSGGIAVSTKTLTLDKGSLFSFSKGSGKAGDIIVYAAESVSLQNGAEIVSSAEASGPGGKIKINTETLKSDASQIASYSLGTGDAGSIDVSASLSASFVNSVVNVSSFSSGASGNVGISATEISFYSDSKIQTTAFGLSRAGNIEVTNFDLLEIDGSGTLVAAQALSSTAAGGNVVFTGKEVLIKNASSISTSTSGSGNAGSIDIDAKTVKLLTGASINSNTASGGNGGTITVGGETIELLSGGNINTGSTGAGSSGDVALTASSQFTVSGSGSFVSADAAGGGKGGDVVIAAGNVTLTGGARIAAAALAAGDAGSVTFDVDGKFQAADSTIFSFSTGTGLAKNISITASEIESTNTQINNNAGSDTGPGVGGIISLNANVLKFSGGQVVGRATGQQDAASIKIGGRTPGTSATLVQLTGGARVVATSELTDALVSAGKVNGRNGAIEIRAADLTINESFVSAAVLGRNDVPGQRAGQGIDLIVGSLSMTRSAIANSNRGSGAGGYVKIRGSSATLNASNVSTRTGGMGSAGGIDVTLTGDLQLANASLVESVSSGEATGNSGKIVVSAREIGLRSGSSIESSKEGSGVAGDVLIFGRTLVIDGLNAPSNSKTGLFADSSALGLGNAGTVTVDVRDFTITNGGLVSAVAQGRGDAGKVRICCLDTFTLSGAGSKIVAGTAVDARGAGGIMYIGAKKVTMSDGGQVTVATLGTGKAGQVNILAQEFNATDNSRAAQGRDAKNATGLATVTGESGDTGAGAGAIKIEAGKFTLAGSAVVSTDSSGVKPAGSIDIRASKFIVSGKDTALASRAVGNKGGAAGNITVGAREFTFSDGATWSSFSESGGGGNLAIDWNLLSGMEDVEVSTNVRGGSSDAGRIDFGFPVAPINLKDVFQAEFNKTIDPYEGLIAYDPNFPGQKFVRITNSKIKASNNGTGDGGPITFNRNVTILSDDNDERTDAAAASGTAGTVTAPAAFVPTTPIIVPERNATTRCEAAQLGSALADNVTGRGAVGEDPGALTPSGLEPSGVRRAASTFASCKVAGL